MTLTIPKDGYWLGEKNIAKIEQMKNAKYIGYFTKKLPSGAWSDDPVDVFYVENPDTSLGHSNYFGMFYRRVTGKVAETIFITDAQTCFDEPIVGLQFEDGTIIISRYRHNFVEHDGCFIDGGRDYTRIGGEPEKFKEVSITVKDGEFIID